MRRIHNQLSSIFVVVSCFSQFFRDNVTGNVHIYVVFQGFIYFQSCLIRSYFLGKIICDTVGICDCQGLQSRIKT